MTTLISITLIVILVIALALVVPVVRRKNREANVARAEQLRSEAATSAQTVLPPAQARAAETEADAAEARAIAERAEAEAQQARIAASQAEAAHEDQIRAADRLDPRVDHTADDYAPQVPGTADVGATPPTEVDGDHEPAATETTSVTPAPATEATPDTTSDTTSDTAPDSTPDSSPDTTSAPSRGATAATVATPQAEETPTDETPTEEPSTEEPRTEEPGTEEPRAEEPAAGGAPLLPRRTPGANEMPGRPMESEGGGGGWFTRKDRTDS